MVMSFRWRLANVTRVARFHLPLPFVLRCSAAARILFLASFSLAGNSNFGAVDGSYPARWPVRRVAGLV